MTQPIYYTILIGKRSCMVKYAAGPAYEVEALIGTFTNPGQASQEIKKALHGKLEHLTEGMFQRKVGTLAERYRQDQAKLAAWNNGKVEHSTT